MTEDRMIKKCGGVGGMTVARENLKHLRKTTSIPLYLPKFHIN
jgi:hypothetical protein